MFYVLAALGALLTVLTLPAIRANLRANASTGDFAGAGLATGFLIVIALPLTLAALVTALWLTRRRGRTEESEPGTIGGPPRGGSGVIVAATFTGLLTVGLTGFLLLQALLSAHRNYSTHGWALVGLAGADLLVLSPLLLVATTLLGVAWRLALRRRSRERSGGKE